MLTELKSPSSLLALFVASALGLFPASPVFAAAPAGAIFSPNQAKYLTLENGDVKAWSSLDDSPIWEFRGSLEGSEGSRRVYMEAKFTLDGSAVALSRAVTGDVWVLDAQNGTIRTYLGSTVAYRVSNSQISPDGRTLLQEDYYGGLALTDIPSKKQFLKLDQGSGSPSNRYRFAEFSKDGRWLNVNNDGFGGQHVWDLKLLRRIDRLPLIRKIPHALTFVRKAIF